jgi:hypothetical protein
MPKLHPSITRALIFAMLVTSAFADTVTLKSGEHIEGKITKETDKDVTIEMRSGGIVDERVVPKAEIEKITKVSPDVEAYRAIEHIRLQPNSFPAAQYDRYIVALEAYVKQYPNSVSAVDVQTTLKGFLEEKKRVENGEAKIEGQWLSKAEVEKEKVQIGGKMAFNYMKAQSTAGDYVDALNAFATIEKSYPGASVMPDAVELAQKIVPALKAEVERSIPEQKILREQRDNGIKTSAPAERAEMLVAAKKEDDAAEAAATEADKTGRWAPLIKSNAKCLSSLLARCTKETPRLAAIKVDNMKRSIEAAESARQSLASGDEVAAGKSLQEATTLWPVNDLARRLTAQISAEKTSASAAAPATPAPTPSHKATPKAKSSTPRPSAAAQASAPAGKTAQSDSGEDRPFYMTLPGAVGIVVGLTVVLAGANVFVKMKKRRAEEAQ